MRKRGKRGRERGKENLEEYAGVRPRRKKKEDLVGLWALCNPQGQRSVVIMEIQICLLLVPLFGALLASLAVG